MKKTIIGFMILLMCSTMLKPAEENPFDLFMGVKWGVNASVLANKLNKKYEIKEIRIGRGLFSGSVAGSIIEANELNIKDGFYIEELEMGSFVTFIMFGFKPLENGLKWKEKNFTKFEFSNAIMMISSNAFESMLGILKSKYGEPKTSKEYEQEIPVYQYKERWHAIEPSKKMVLTQMLQHEITWENNDRIITLYNYSYNDGEIGFVMFDKIDENSNKEAADIL